MYQSIDTHFSKYSRLNSTEKANMEAFEYKNSSGFVSGGKYEENPKVKLPNKKFTSVRDYMKIKES